MEDWNTFDRLEGSHQGGCEEGCEESGEEGCAHWRSVYEEGFYYCVECGVETRRCMETGQTAGGLTKRGTYMYDPKTRFAELIANYFGMTDVVPKAVVRAIRKRVEPATVSVREVSPLLNAYKGFRGREYEVFYRITRVMRPVMAEKTRNELVHEFGLFVPFFMRRSGKRRSAPNLSTSLFLMTTLKGYLLERRSLSIPQNSFGLHERLYTEFKNL